MDSDFAINPTRIGAAAKWSGKVKIFWSWQSDTHQPSGRYFVREVLEELAKDLNGANEAEEAERPDRDEDESQDDDRINVDHDTLGVGGSPRIADTILRKIAEAAIFVADVTPVGNTTGGKRLPNPNVMIELGYALHALDLERIVLVMNRAEGAALKNLPFDLRHWRAPVTYSLARDASEEKKTEVAEQLKENLRRVIVPGLKAAAKAFREEKRRVQRAPELTVELDPEHKGPFLISQVVKDLGVPSLNEIRAEHPLLPIPKPDQMLGGPIFPSRVGASSAFAIIGRPKPVEQWTREEKVGFNKLREHYYREYQAYLEAIADYIRLAKRTISVNLILVNTGTLPASDIDLEIIFPEGIVLHDEEGFPERPSPPSPPPLEPPPSVAIARQLPIELPSLRPALTRSTSFFPLERRVHARLGNLKHNHQYELEEFFISFATPHDVGSFEADYVITANELIDPIHGTIQFDAELVDR
jgi:hypothetical protein